MFQKTQNIFGLNLSIGKVLLKIMYQNFKKHEYQSLIGKVLQNKTWKIEGEIAYQSLIGKVLHIHLVHIFLSCSSINLSIGMITLVLQSLSTTFRKTRLNLYIGMITLF